MVHYIDKYCLPTMSICMFYYDKPMWFVDKSFHLMDSDNHLVIDLE